MIDNQGRHILPYNTKGEHMFEEGLDWIITRLTRVSWMH